MGTAIDSTVCVRVCGAECMRVCVMLSFSCHVFLSLLVRHMCFARRANGSHSGMIYVYPYHLNLDL